ncbi:dimethyladenosine transferase 1, mitochondrial-like [Mercenaria mercenaria]|uniref:dimethyladenosine transferase 1, mitochondrial-like n=1 Tax=Mercenaria mercenaria TaxID=6596 RepID=UPI00234E9D02|nr:dimethyladenosine transferase 1, mitochondrial-like [Mercenaria mercenaria]
MRLPPLPTIGDVVRLYKLSAAKRLSQNFIMDMSLNHKIVRYAGKLDDCYVCEVGPGPGGITRAILEKNVKHLYVIEKDKRFFPGLQMLADASGRLTAYHGDVLRFNMDNLFPEECIRPWTDDEPNLHIIGNLPFNVATPLIFQYMEAISNRTGAWRYGRTRMTLTFQKEVAERMVAKEESANRCRLSVDIQNLCEVKLKMIIPGRAFVPAPEVDVGLVHLIPRKKPRIDLPYRLIVKVNRHLFHYRQKMCKNSLKTLFPNDQPDLLYELIDEARINPERKSTDFNINQIGRICHAYNKICQRLPYIYHYDYRNPKSKKEYEQICKLENELQYGLVDKLDFDESTGNRSHSESSANGNTDELDTHGEVVS